MTFWNTGKAAVTVTVAEAEAYEQATKDVAVTIGKAASRVGTAPGAKSLIYNGEAQELVTAGTAIDGTMEYSLDGKTFSKEVPTATDAGTYTVWYKVIGDANHSDTAAESMQSTVAKQVVAADKTSATVNGLKAGKRAWVQVRPLRRVDGTTYTGVLTRAKATVKVVGESVKAQSVEPQASGHLMAAAF